MLLLKISIIFFFLHQLVLIFTYTRIAFAVWGKKPPGEGNRNGNVINMHLNLNGWFYFLISGKFTRSTYGKIQTKGMYWQFLITNMHAKYFLNRLCVKNRFSQNKSRPFRFICIAIFPFILECPEYPIFSEGLKNCYTIYTKHIILFLLNSHIKSKVMTRRRPIKSTFFLWREYFLFFYVFIHKMENINCSCSNRCVFSVLISLITA